MTGIDLIKARAFGAGGGGSGGSGGGSELLNSLIDRSITEINSDASRVGDRAFIYCQNLTTADFPVATSIGNYAFQTCINLTTTNFPVATSIGSSAFNGCGNLTTADFPVATSIANNAFYDCGNLTALILRNASLCTLSATNALNSTPIKSGTGYIYVPSALVDTYKTATNWSTYAAQFRALEDYTVDGTITGALDPEKIGA